MRARLLIVCRQKGVKDSLFGLRSCLSKKQWVMNRSHERQVAALYWYESKLLVPRAHAVFFVLATVQVLLYDTGTHNQSCSAHCNNEFIRTVGNVQ